MKTVSILSLRLALLIPLLGCVQGCDIRDSKSGGCAPAEVLVARHEELWARNRQWHDLAVVLGVAGDESGAPIWLETAKVLMRHQTKMADQGDAMVLQYLSEFVRTETAPHSELFNPEGDPNAASNPVLIHAGLVVSQLRKRLGDPAATSIAGLISRAEAQRIVERHRVMDTWTKAEAGKREQAGNSGPLALAVGEKEASVRGIRVWVVEPARRDGRWGSVIAEPVYVRVFGGSVCQEGLDGLVPYGADHNKLSEPDLAWQKVFLKGMLLQRLEKAQEFLQRRNLLPPGDTLVWRPAGSDEEVRTYFPRQRGMDSAPADGLPIDVGQYHEQVLAHAYGLMCNDDRPSPIPLLRQHYPQALAKMQTASRRCSGGVTEGGSRSH